MLLGSNFDRILTMTIHSVFESIDKRSESFVDNPELAHNFTRMVINRATVSAEGIEINMVHLGEPSDEKKQDFEGHDAYRRYAIWRENENLFGAWIFVPTNGDPHEIDDLIVYPQILGGVVKKSHQIVEDVYYIERLNLPVEWVTYHNSQG